jgi:biotin carboxylase
VGIAASRDDCGKREKAYLAVGCSRSPNGGPVVTKRRILVTGAGGSAGINFINSLRLARRSYFIIGVDVNQWHLELPNVDAAYVIPKALESGYIRTLQKLIRKERAEFLHPQPDVEVEIISEHREELGTRTYLPAKETVRLCRDKMATNARLRSGDVPVPESFLVERIRDIGRILGRLRRGDSPVWLRAVRGAGSRAALPVKTVRQAREWIHYWRTMRALESRDFMMAEFLPGREYAFQSLWQDGDLITSACRMRLEYLMGNLSVSGQSSSPSVAVTVHNDQVNDIASRAVRTIDRHATGVFCLDLKENPKGIPCVTEINAGRFFTTSNFFARLGANMPDDLIRLAFGEKLPERQKYNAVPSDCYWIRLMDAGPVLVRGERWRGSKA